MTAAVIHAVFAGYRLIMGRSCLQLHLEIPVERQGEAFAALGYPEPGKQIDVAVARLKPNTASSHEAGERPGDGMQAPPRQGDLSQSAAAPSLAASPAVVPERAENRDANSQNPRGRGLGADTDDPPSVRGLASGDVSDSPARDMEKARVRAVLLCKDARFRAWAVPVPPGGDNRFGREEATAEWLRAQLGIASRSEIATDYEVYLRFVALEGRYQVATGLRAEERG